MNLSPYEFENAKEGSLFVKKGNKLVAVDFEKLVDPINEDLKVLPKLEREINDLVKYTRHFKTFAKSHFLVVYNAFKIKVAIGELQVDDEEVLNLDEKVLNDEISVEEAISKHDYLKTTFEKLFIHEKEVVEFPEI